ncbi:MAG: hypothetical protein WCE51_02665 [Chthoniobacterales bacterium]
MHASAIGARRILFILSGLALSGVGLAWWLSGTFAGHPDPRSTYSAFYVIFARDEILGLALIAVFGIVAALLFFGRRNHTGPVEEISRALPREYLLVTLIAAGVFAITALGTHFVCHDYALSADEFMADFQAQIFLRGQVTAEVPPQWVDAVRVIKPTFADYFPATHEWKATYLPVYAAMRAVFQSVHLQSFLNPCLAALTILALFGTARNIWPDKKENAFVAILLLAGSAQFLVMAMTAYSMPAHLALNTIWLWLYSRPDRRRFYLAPVLGVLAIGLHQPNVHALFVTPFLFRLVLSRKWRAVFIFGFTYLLGCVAWYAWRAKFSPPSTASVGSIFRLWNPKMLVIQPMDLLLVVGWSALATPLLAVIGFGRIFREKPIIRDAALSCLLTFGFYYFFYLDQGHGWGYRYFHGTLSCLILVAIAGWVALVERCGERNAQRFLFVAMAASLFVALPLRCLQAESFIRPFAETSETIHSMNASVVGLDPHLAWYSADLIRNDPFLENRPVVAALVNLWPAEVAALAQAGKAQFLSRKEIGAFGLATTPREPLRRDSFRLGRGP